MMLGRLSGRSQVRQAQSGCSRRHEMSGETTEIELSAGWFFGRARLRAAVVAFSSMGDVRDYLVSG